MNHIFKLVERTPQQVILEVCADDPLTVARHPYVSANYAYITVTRGNNHTLTVIHKDGHTFSFHWGDNGHTLISDNLERLRKEVVHFIENDNMIPLEWDDGAVDKATIYYHPNFQSWQLTLEGKRGNRRISAYIRNDYVDSIEEMFELVRPLVGAVDWEPQIAVTGIRMWVHQ